MGKARGLALLPASLLMALIAVPAQGETNERVSHAASADKHARSATEEQLSPMAQAVQDLTEGEAGASNRAALAAAEDGPTSPAFSDAELAAELEENGATNVVITGVDEPDEVVYGDGGFPQDLFKVSGSWADWVQNGKRYIAFYGRWNYSDEYIGSGDPYDAAAIAVDNFDDRCWTNVSTGLKTQDNSGDLTNLRSRRDAWHKKTVWNVHDDTSGFELLTDMGFAWIEMRRDALGCDSDKKGKFHHVHNKQGSGSWTFGITILAFNIEYTGDDPDKQLQKSTRLKTYDYAE